ncbi:MAG: hypothetical protein AAGC93_06785 [Cyanobacteria bacterium P01_F01_bin.53]
MNTPAHAIFNLALLGRKQRPEWNPLIIWGALIPDLAMFGFYLLLKFANIPESQIWGEEYYRPFWQNLFDFFNSIPLALVGIAVMFYLRKTGIALLFGSIVLHCLQDLPLHVDDGHRHFWPFSQFRFESAVSYWDPNHYGMIAAPVELALAMIASIYVFRRVRSRWTKGLLIAANALPPLVYLWFAVVI